MQVFISWSGDESKRVAMLLKEWLPTVIQAVGEPFVSAADIDKGETWFTAISNSLVKAEGLGIFCLTSDNLSAPWMAFEAGALAVNDRGRVATFLHGVTPADLKTPLSLFQATLASSKEDVLNLLRMINKRITPPLPDGRLEKAFESNWSTLVDELEKIKPSAVSKHPKASSQQIQTDLLESILSTVRRIEKDSSRRSDPPATENWFGSPAPVPPGGGLLGSVALDELARRPSNVELAIRHVRDADAKKFRNWVAHNASAESLKEALGATSEAEKLRSLLGQSNSSAEALKAALGLTSEGDSLKELVKRYNADAAGIEAKDSFSSLDQIKKTDRLDE